MDDTTNPELGCICIASLFGGISGCLRGLLQQIEDDYERGDLSNALARARSLVADLDKAPDHPAKPWVETRAWVWLHFLQREADGASAVALQSHPFARDYALDSTIDESQIGVPCFDVSAPLEMRFDACYLEGRSPINVHSPDRETLAGIVSWE